MNAIEIETGKKFTEWRTAVDIVRTELNKIRYKKAPYTAKTIYKKVDKVDLSNPNKFHVGDIVHRKLNYPEDALGNKQPTAVFRTGDFRWSAVPQKIVKVLYYSGKIPYRYMLDGITTASFTESQLMPSKAKEQEFTVKQIIGKKTINKKIHYLVWWKGYKKSESTWEPRTKLIEDGQADRIREYEKKIAN